MTFVKTVKRLAAGAAAAFITVSSMPAGSFTAFAEAIPSNPQPPSGGELIYSVDPFDAEHSAGYFCVKDSILHGVYSTSTGEVYGTNTQRNEEIYVDHHEGACFNGTYYDVREYPWQTECESYAIDERGVNGAAGTEMARVHREFHFYEAGTLDTDNPVEVSFKGVMRFTDLDNHEGYTFDQGLYAAWLNNPTNVERIDELTWKGTWENRNDDVNWEHETLWVEVESSPERPLIFTYWVYNIHGSGINYYGNTITYTLVEDGKDALPPDAKPAVGVHCATYAAYDLMPEDEFLRYQFDGWYYDPQLTQKVPDTIMVSEDHVFYGTYHKVAGLITTEVVNGTITPTDECVPYGTDKQIEYAPMEGYLLDTVTIDGQSYDPGEVPSGFTFTNVQEDHYVKVVYAPAEMDKSVSMEESATIENYAGNADIEGQVVRDGDIVSYLISYENPTSVVRTIMITDNVPETVHVVPDSISDNGVLEDGKIIWSVQAEPYSRGEVYFNGIVSEEAEGKIVKNSAVVTLQPIVTDGTENAVTLEDTVETPVLPDPSKSAFSENGIDITNQIVNSGSVVVYQITFENPSDSEKLFTVTDSVPPEVTYLDGTASDGGQYSDGRITWSVNMAPHEIRTVSFQVKVNDPQGAYTHIFNQAEVAVDGTAKTTDSPEHTLEEDPARTPVYVLDSPVKTVLNADGRNIGADSDGNPIQTVKQTGDTLFYQVTFGNPADDTRIFTVTDTIPEGLRLVNATDDAVYDEASRTLTWTLEVSSQTQYTVGIQAEILKEAEGTVLRNHATVNVDQACMDTNEVQTPVLAAPVKDVYSGAGGSSLNAFPVTAGQSLIYTVTWKNPSDMPKTAVITDILPEGVLFLGADQEGVYSEEEHAVVWNVVTEAHSEGTVMVKVEVSETMAGTVLNNRAAVRMDEAEMPSVTVNDGNPEDTAVNYVAAKTVTDSEGNDINGMLTSVGDLITYHIPFQNHSAGTCVYKIQDVLPQGITFVEASGSGNVQSVVHGQTVTWTLEVPAKTAGEVWVTAKVTDSLKGQAFANSAVLEVQEPETGRTGKAMTNQVINYVLDDIRKEVLSENGKKNLEGEKVRGGTELLYRVTFQNTAAAEKAFTVTDELPEGVIFVEAGENGTFDETTGLISWEGTLGAGKTGSVSFRVTVNETADCDFIQNTAKVSVDGTEADSNTVKVYVKGDKATDPECTEKEEVKPGPETDPEEIKPAESEKETEKQPEKETERKGEEDPPAQTEKPAEKHDKDTGDKPGKECPEKPAEQEPNASGTTSDPEKNSSSTGTVTPSTGTPVSTGNTSPSGISTGISGGTKTGQATPGTGNGSSGSGITAPGTTGTGVTKSGTTGTGFTSTGTAGTIPSGITGTGTTSTGTGSKGTTVPSAVTAGTASGSGITPTTVSGTTSETPGKSDGGDLPGVTSVTTDIPRTGDDSNVILWALIAVSCGIAAILITVFAINPGKKEEDDWEA